MGHAEFLELVLADEVTRREATPRSCGHGPPGSIRPCASRTGTKSAEVTCHHAILDELVSLRFIDAGDNVLILGPVGVGKTFLATALGHAAVRQRYSVHFERGDQLLKRLEASRLDNSHDAELRKLLRVDLLILDGQSYRRRQKPAPGRPSEPAQPRRRRVV